MKKWDWRALKLNMKICGWWLPVVSFSLLVLFTILLIANEKAGHPIPMGTLRRAVETIIPVCFCAQVAFLLGPDNEPALELLLSTPKPMGRIFLERLSLVGGLQFLIALLFSLVYVHAWHIEDLPLAMVRWLVDGLVLGGVAVFTTQLTRQGVFGMLLSTLLWASSLAGGTAILRKWHWFWAFHIYLQPETLGMATFILNRLVLACAGIALFMAGLWYLGKEERLLGSR